MPQVDEKKDDKDEEDDDGKQKAFEKDDELDALSRDSSQRKISKPLQDALDKTNGIE